MARKGIHSRRLHSLFDSDWKDSMVEHPEFGTFLGNSSRDDQWTDHSPRAIRRRQKKVVKSLETLRAIPRSKVDPADRLNYDLYERGLVEGVESARFADELIPLSQMSGIQQDLERYISMTAATTIGGYENVIARLESVPTWVDQTIELMELGLSKGITPPRLTVKDVPRQVRAQILKEPSGSNLLTAFNSFPETVPAKARRPLKARARRAVEKRVFPALRLLADFVDARYLPNARKTTGMSDLPDGAAWYDHKIAHYTTTRLTARELHELGLSEVARVRKLMERQADSLGFKGDFPRFCHHLRTDPKFFHKDAESLLRGYRDIAKRIDPGLVTQFGRLPRLPYGITPVPSHSEKSAPTAYFIPGSTEGGRPGWYFANTYNLKARPIWEMESLTLHEAVPGHHLQIAIASELEGLPEFRRHGMYMAYIEGWALYAESLGEVFGLYADPYSKAGQYSFEIWRACRLVVDTGLHAFGWSRKKAIDYLVANTAKVKHDATVEVDRYIALPGQALSYKVGELAIQKIRCQALAALGEKFDVRAFHDALLENGALPLDNLQKLMSVWIGKQKRRLGA